MTDVTTLAYVRRFDEHFAPQWNDVYSIAALWERTFGNGWDRELRSSKGNGTRQLARQAAELASCSSLLRSLNRDSLGFSFALNAEQQEGQVPIQTLRSTIDWMWKQLDYMAHERASFARHPASTSLRKAQWYVRRLPLVLLSIPQNEGAPVFAALNVKLELTSVLDGETAAEHVKTGALRKTWKLFKQGYLPSTSKEIEMIVKRWRHLVR